MAEFLMSFLRGKGTYSLVAIGILAVLLKLVFHVDVNAMVSGSPEVQSGIQTIFTLLLAAALRRGMAKK